MRLKNSTAVETSQFLAIFSLLWAIAAVFHYFSMLLAFAPGEPGDFLYILSLLVFLAAISIILKPTSLARLNIYCFLQVIEVLYQMPEVPNHWLLTFFVNSAILASYSYRGEDREQKLFSAIRLILVVIYFFAFFHKLNSDFLNLVHSCAVIYYNQASRWFAFFPKVDVLKYLAIYGTLVAEFLIFVFLLTKKFKKSAIFIGLFLHLSFTFSVEKSFYNFSAPMFVLLLLYLNEASFLEIYQSYSKKFWLTIKNVLLTTIIILFALNFLSYKQPYYDAFIVGTNILWFVCATFVIFLFVRFYGQLKTVSEKPVFSLLYIFVFLVFLNGLSPYLGLKTRTAWQMYSNLWISHQDSNHLVVPRSLDVFGYLEAKDGAKRSEIEKRLTIFSAWEREAAKQCVW